MIRPKIGWAWGIFIIAAWVSPVAGQSPVSQVEKTSEQPQVVQIYFADAHNRYLSPQPVELVETATPVEMAAQLIEHLNQAPHPPLGPVLPTESTIRSLFLDADGTAYVDLPGSVVDRFAGGVATELLAAYAIANTLILNSAAIDRVQLLVDGRPARTLAGHIDISRPLRANMMLIR